MELWIDAEYRNVLAVIAAWMTALIPWNVTHSALDIGTVLFVRFPLFQVRYIYGFPLAKGLAIQTAPGAMAFQQGQTIVEAYTVWVVGAAVFVVALLLSFAMYAFEENVANLPVPFEPSRVMGGLLVVTAVVLSVATWLLYTRGFPGIPIPIGVVALYVLGGILLLAEYR